MWLLLFLLLFLAVAVCGLLFKIHSIYHAVGELRVQLAERIQADTNTGIDLTYLDRRINRLVPIWTASCSCSDRSSCSIQEAIRN